ncbi:cation:proton antiporter [Actinoalloteichus sp. GBA129-24]|uniref:cation:proton antiporter n=1 Tax=Actinoalloteichus sp. GBA129-24 TaxID=1612551 RepID=UPI0009531093|nr:cation:proton antiporter [Actinoalloteichus sp. GBA129-24]
MELQACPLVAIVLAIDAAAGLVAVRPRRPLIVVFIGVGIPVGTGWVEADGTIELPARMGIAVLLFLVGPRQDPHPIRSTGPVALATGLGQVVFTSVFGYLIALGMDSGTAFDVVIALTFSSTIIILKLLASDGQQVSGRDADSASSRGRRSPSMASGTSPTTAMNTRPCGRGGGWFPPTPGAAKRCGAWTRTSTGRPGTRPDLSRQRVVPGPSRA